MANIDTARSALLNHLDTATPEGGLSEEGFARLGELVRDLCEHTLYPKPAERPEKLAGRWETLFAHFGARHSAGKPREHDSTLKAHSFNRFPELPIRVNRICQEVAANGSQYNNVVSIAAPNGATHGIMITQGEWRIDTENAQRLHVDFSGVRLEPDPGISAAQLRAGLGLPVDHALRVDLKPPRLHSDVVYLDNQYRINIGSFGGLYVLKRLTEAPLSFSLP
jgi:hypothetical protein